MLTNRKKWGMMLLLSGIFSVVLGVETNACKVLVVQSYSEPFYWSQEHNKAIEKVFNNRCELKSIYLDEDIAPDKTGEKGQQAFHIYQEWQPDGVIAVDDAAQREFVVPYLKERVATPVIFSGVFDPENFGYPAANVTGVKQIAHWEEFVTFAQQLVPSIKTVGSLVPDIPKTHAGIPFLEKALQQHAMKPLPAFYSNDSELLLAKAIEWESQADALFTIPLIGENVTKKLISQFKKPTFTGWRQAVEWGVLCAVTDSGEELGRLAAQMLLNVLDGTPISDMPITHNEFGTRMINVDTLKALGIQPSRRVLAGVELIKTK